MMIHAYLDVAPEPGESPIEVRDRAETIIKDAGLKCTSIEAITAKVIITEVAEEEPKPRQTAHRVYSSPLYPGTDEFHEFYIEKHLT